MDPSTFETMREEQLQTRESVDITNAAHILGRTLGVPLDGAPPFMKPQDIPGLPNQEGIPSDHDCTICAATAACGFFSEAQKNGGDNPMMRRLKAVQELTKSSPDLLKGPDAEHLIREKMAALKTQATSVIESPQSDRSVKKKLPKPTELTEPDPVQVVTEKTAVKPPKPNTVEQATVIVTKPAESERPDLKTIVAQFESKVQPRLSVEKPNVTTTAPNRAVSTEINNVPQHEEKIQSLPQTEAPSTTSTIDMVEKPTQQEAYPKNKTEQIPTETPKTPKTDATQTQQTEPKEVQKPSYKPTVPEENIAQKQISEPKRPLSQVKHRTQPMQISIMPKENTISQNNTVQEYAQAVATDTDLPDSLQLNNAPPAVYTIKPRPEPTPTHAENGDKPLSVVISHQPVSSESAPIFEATTRTQLPSEPVIMSVQETPVERPLPDQAKNVMYPSTPFEKEVPSAYMESGFVIPDLHDIPDATEQATPPIVQETRPQTSPVEILIGADSISLDAPLPPMRTIPIPHPENIMTAPPVNDAEHQVTGAIPFPAPEPKSATGEEKQTFLSEGFLQTERQEWLPNDNEPVAVTEAVLTELSESETVFVADQSLALEVTIQEDTRSHSDEFHSEFIPEEQDSVSAMQYESEEMVLIEERSLSRTEDIKELQPVLHIEHTITLFSYEDLYADTDDEGVDSAQEEEKQTEVLPIFDLPLVPLDTIDVEQLIKFEIVGFVEETAYRSEDKSNVAYLDASIKQAEEISERVFEHPDETINAPEIIFPEPFPLILEAEQEEIDQIFNGIEEQQYETTTVLVLAVPMHESERNEAGMDSMHEEVPSQPSQSEVTVFVWNESLFEQMTDLIETVFEVLKDPEIEKEVIDGLFDILFDSNPDIADEELKNDTFGKYDDTVILLWYILMIFSLFGQAMLYINPEAIKEHITYPSHNTGFPRPSDSEAHINM